MTPSVSPNSSKPFHHTVVVIPLGPSEPVEHILDTLDSIQRFLSPDTKVILVDNSRKGTGNIVQQAFPDADVIHGTRQGMFAHLFLNICQGTAHAYEHYCFRVLLRMDTDALIIGELPDVEASAVFEQRPDVGQLGVFKTDYHGRPMRWWPINLSMALQALNPLSWIWPAWNGFAFRQLLVRAMRRGYPIGSHVYGGGFFLSYACVERLYRAGILTDERLDNLRLAEDHITTVSVVSVGLDAADFASGDRPCAQAWRGLPAAPDELLAKGKKVVHSVRFWGDMKEADVRAVFRRHRAPAVQVNVDLPESALAPAPAEQLVYSEVVS